MNNHPNPSKTAPQFHEGQEVDVHRREGAWWIWRKAKIGPKPWVHGPGVYPVIFPEDDPKTYKFHGASSVFDAEHIRAIPIEDIREIADEDRKN